MSTLQTVNIHFGCNKGARHMTLFLIVLGNGGYKQWVVLATLSLCGSQRGSEPCRETRRRCITVGTCANIRYVLVSTENCCSAEQSLQKVVVVCWLLVRVNYVNISFCRNECN